MAIAGYMVATAAANNRPPPAVLSNAGKHTSISANPQPMLMLLISPLAIEASAANGIAVVSKKGVAAHA
jgi:hypothetical protein